MAVIVPLLVAGLVGPTRTAAQGTMNAQQLTPEGIALTAAELGPEWSVAEQHSETLDDGSRLYRVRYSSPGGRFVILNTAVTSNADLAEAVISMLRYQLESEGATIASVQSNGFGDGRAFRAEGSDGQHRLIVYLFRVHNLMAFSGYEGAASAADVPSLATAVARQQEAKLFAAIAPPDAVAAAPVVPPTDVPAPIPTPTPPPETPVVVASQPSSQTAAPFCHPGDQPQFHLGFATLSSQLGPRMGAPTSCEFSDPSGSGDTLQTTTTGLATYRVATGVATFTNGSEHWALQGGVTLYWTGDSIDPADNAQPFAG